MEEMMKDTQAAQSAAQPTAGAQAEKKPRFSLPKGKKGKKWLKILIAVAVVAAIAVGCVANAAKKVNSQIAGGYLVAQAVRQDLVLSVTGTATLKPADSYNVTTLLSGTIEDAPFEEDDQVEKGDLLFAMDSSDAQNRVDQASISVSQAKIAYQQASEAANPTATISGTINELYVHNGDSVSMGSPIAKLISSRDLTVDFLFPYAKPTDFYVGQPASVYVGNFDAPVDGTVESVSNETTLTSNGMNSVSVRVKITNPGGISDAYTASARIGAYASYGQTSINMGGSTTVYASGSGTIQNLSKLAGSTVKQGEPLCTVESADARNRVENARLSLQNAELAASMAADSLDDYNITSQITGRVIEKNFKAGDKVDGVSSGTLAVIYDLSHLKMEMNVSELDIAKVKVGQSVEITCSAVPGKTFAGVVDRVSINGTTTDGFTNYPVTIVLQDYGDLKPGMNVSASIIGETVEDAVSVPVGAVSRGNTVQVALPGALAEDGVTVADPSKVEERAVTLGINDENYIEITSGLEAGETVLMESQTGVMGG